MRTMRRTLLRVLIALGILAPMVVVGATMAQAATFTPLTLLNGWTNAPFGTNKAAVANIAGVVTFKGAIATSSTNSNTEPFVLPAADRPSTEVYVPVDMCDATNGRLDIAPDGVVTVDTVTLSNAQCFTSLDGVSFIKTTSVTPLVLLNGWTGAPFGAASPAATNHGGVVSLKGAIATSSGNTNTEPFVLPPPMRPSTEVYVPVDMCGATNGRLIIAPSGEVNVQEETASSGNAQCFTSLDGASFVKSGPTTALTLLHGWTGTPFGTADPAVTNIGGIVRFQGAISTSGSVAKPFTLPTAFRPVNTVYIKVDLCNATNGRLQIGPGGVVTVETETGFSNAQCFTSLDGASFAQ